MPCYFTDSLKSLLNGLLTMNPSKRLGSKSINEIKNHPFFQDIDWKKMEKK